jgi:signal transduction histidine kinase
VRAHSGKVIGANVPGGGAVFTIQFRAESESD